MSYRRVASPFPAPSATPSPAEDAPGTGAKEDAPSGGMDLSPLQEVNADVVGWIEIPGVGTGGEGDDRVLRRRRDARVDGRPLQPVSDEFLLFLRA